VLVDGVSAKSKNDAGNSGKDDDKDGHYGTDGWARGALRFRLYFRLRFRDFRVLWERFVMHADFDAIQRLWSCQTRLPAERYDPLPPVGVLNQLSLKGRLFSRAESMSNVFGL
jgi:hypothetical protein